ncbi:MAG: DNA polymerase III subunit gamma/tau [Dehalococcoidia bacterium]|nr:DNA polymerase III subunit gamma/tau [Dehalococcoidia bacterium]MDW8119408.1 DNA polymerase III subunit gamma/tau [Chloroflexota bacterium]
MASQGLVLYRKYRPRRFSEVVGQEWTVQALRRAVAQGKIVHAYLFAGPRGTGKTTIARILAKAVNCQAPQEGEPCTTCPQCRAVEQGDPFLVVELDAASHRGIEDVRAIREAVLTMGQGSGRYRVYILDEAHMLTHEAFNALLKTLEEPPPHVLFILCTTEAYRLPPTVVSRCQRYDFHRLSPSAVAQRLAHIAQQEGWQIGTEALHLLATAARGSLRDACNLLEQVVTTYGPEIGPQQVAELLGLRDNPFALALLHSLSKGDVAGALSAIAQGVAASEGDPRAFHRVVMTLLQNTLRLKAGAPVEDVPPETVEALRSLASAWTWERLLGAVRALGSVTFRGDAFSSLPLELAVVEVLAEPSPAPTVSPSPSPRSTPPPSAPALYPTPPVRPPPLTPASPSPPPPPSAERADPRWRDLCRALERVRNKRFPLGPLLRGYERYTLEGDILTIFFRHRTHWERLRDELEHPASKAALDEAVAKIFGHPYTVRLELAEGESPSTLRPQGHLLRTALQLGGRIVGEHPADSPQEEKP